MLRHLAVKFDFLHLGNIPPFPLNNVDVNFSIFRQRRLQPLNKIEFGGRGYQRINASLVKRGYQTVACELLLNFHVLMINAQTFVDAHRTIITHFFRRRKMYIQLSMRLILSATGTYNFNLAKWLEEKLKPLSANEHTITDMLEFVDEISSSPMNEEDILVSYDVTALLPMYH